MNFLAGSLEEVGVIVPDVEALSVFMHALEILSSIGHRGDD